MDRINGEIEGKYLEDRPYYYKDDNNIVWEIMWHRLPNGVPIEIRYPHKRYR